VFPTRDYLLIFYLFLNFIHSFARQSIPVLIVNIVGIPTCSQHLLTWFVRRPDDGHVRTETCSLTHNKAWCVWRKVFYIILVLNFNTSGCLQSKRSFRDSYDADVFLLFPLCIYLPFVKPSLHYINTSSPCRAAKVKIDSRRLWKWKE